MNPLDRSGGNIIFQAGAGAKDPDGRLWPDGDIIFKFADGTEVMRLHANGCVTIFGENVADDAAPGAVYREFKAWLKTTRIEEVKP